jgi:hypothetical protein
LLYRPPIQQLVLRGLRRLGSSLLGSSLLGSSLLGSSLLGSSLLGSSLLGSSFGLGFGLGRDLPVDGTLSVVPRCADVECAGDGVLREVWCDGGNDPDRS